MTNDRDRAGTVLLRELARLPGEEEPGDALRRILRADAVATAIERVSYWSIRDGGASIVCEGLHRQSDGAFEQGLELFARDFPRYFAALSAGEVIAAADAHADPRTGEFSAGYLGPNGIGAMLDVPVFVAGALAGVVCHEHVGGARTFTAYEQQLAMAVAQSLAQVLEARARRKAQDTVRASEARFRQLVEVSPVPTLVTRVADGQILYANSALAKLMRTPVAELLARRSVEFYQDPEERAYLMALLRSEGKLREEELRLVRPDGSTLWAMLSVDPLEFDGQPALLCGIVDLTEHKETEASVQRALRTLEERDLLKSQDLERARAFQQSMLPPPIERRDLSVETVFQPLEEVSGDLYEWEVLGDSVVRLFVADATGHGVSAALTTMFLRSEHDVVRDTESTPRGVLRALNTRVARFSGRLTMRLTAACLTLDLRSGLVRWSSAAHPPPFLLRDGVANELSTGGSFVGLLSDLEFPEWSISLRPGDTVGLYTDGLSEALDPSGKPFGERRLHEAMSRAARAGAPIGQAALAAALEYAGALQDDATLVALRWQP